MNPPSVFAIVLGIMQDGGLPHVGCRCARCMSGRGERVACLAVVDERQDPPGVWVIDATPDISPQFAALARWLGPDRNRPGRLRQPDGIFLTHGHIGHTTGLAHLGPEGMFVRRLPVFGPAGLLAAIDATPLWLPLRRELDFRSLVSGERVNLAPDLSIRPLAVPHRDELGAGTFGYLVDGPSRSLLYVPDIDDWQAWPEADRWLASADIALVDASFFSTGELGGRPPVAHPLVPDTLAYFSDYSGELVLTHLNHTNPLLDSDSPETATVLAAGARVARQGEIFPLDVPALKRSPIETFDR